MYLSDVHIRQELHNMQIRTEDPEDPFRPDEQIQPCSIDLRLGHVFWKQRRKRAIDLSHAGLPEVQPRRHWRRHEVNAGQSITLHPGEMLLGRTFEHFAVPATCAGKLEGRSSFARMGLSVHCTGDFINPAWYGHMPLQLVNHGRTPIKLVPRLHVCQLILVRLSHLPNRTYGRAELYSKYINDDGGPSFWWRDRRISNLHDSFGYRNIKQEIQESIYQVIANEEAEVIDRLEDFVETMQAGQLTNAQEILESFSQKEQKTLRWARIKYEATRWVGPAAFVFSLGVLFERPLWSLHYVAWAISCVLVIVSAWAWLRLDPPGRFITPNELDRLRNQ